MRGGSVHCLSKTVNGAPLLLSAVCEKHDWDAVAAPDFLKQAKLFIGERRSAIFGTAAMAPRN
jgi:hypothetical protein